MGKNLRGWEEEYQYFSGKASEATRSLAFGGLAVIWLFKELVPIRDTPFLWPTILFALSLAFDFLHYFIAAWIWKKFYIYHEENTPIAEQNDIEAPKWKRTVVDKLYDTKIWLTLVAYIILIVILSTKLF
jgi:Fe2+ transport system protein B